VLFTSVIRMVLEAEMEDNDGLVLDDETRHNVLMLRSRAGSLVAQASSVGEPLGTAYRRRARELELEAFLVETRGAARVA
jgi:hypothetical protein